MSNKSLKILHFGGGGATAHKPPPDYVPVSLYHSKGNIKLSAVF